MPSQAQDEVKEWRANQDQVILQDIPQVPASVQSALSQYQNIRFASFEDWHPNLKSLLIKTRFADVTQLHRVDQIGGARHQLTFFKEPISNVLRRPNSEEVAFLMDSGGNEAAQIFLLNLKTGESRMISDGVSRYGALLWTQDGNSLAFQSTQRDGVSNDVWLMDLSDHSSQGPSTSPKSSLLVKSPNGTWWGPVAFSRTQTHLLIQNYISSTDSRIYLKNLKTGELTLVAGKENAESKESAQDPVSTRNFAIDFSADRKGFFYLTDQASDFTQLAYQKLDRSSPKMITQEISWDLSYMVLNERGDRGAFVVNEGGSSQLYLFDPRSHAYQKVPQLPIGIIRDLTFHPKAPSLAFTLNTPQTPSDTFVLNLDPKEPLRALKLDRWTQSEIGGLDAQQMVIPELIKYPTFDQVSAQSDELSGQPKQVKSPRTIPAYIYRPTAPFKPPYPVIISIHGGPESQYRPYFSSTYQLWLKKLGVAVISPNVRGSAGYGKQYLKLDNGFKREDSVKDIGALLDWIKTQPDLDQDRVIVFGGSYGGYMVLASAVHFSDRLKGAVDIVGISNFVTFLKNTKSYRRDLRRVEYGDERDPKMYAFLEKISPNRHVDQIKIPLLVVQGQNDPRVPVSEAVQIVEALRSQGQKVWYMNALNEGHGYRKKLNRDLYQSVVVLFLQKVLNLSIFPE